MSLSVHNEASGLEYNATSLATLFCQRRNLFSPRFYRAHPRHPALLSRGARRCCRSRARAPRSATISPRIGYGAAFRDEHLVPMSLGPVVGAAARGARLSGQLSGAVPGEPRDAAGERPRALARGAGRLREVRRGARARAGTSTCARGLPGEAHRSHGCRHVAVHSARRHRALRSGRARLPQRSGARAARRRRRTRERDILGAIGYQPNA